MRQGRKNIDIVNGAVLPYIAARISGKDGNVAITERDTLVLPTARAQRELVSMIEGVREAPYLMNHALFFDRVVEKGAESVVDDFVRLVMLKRALDEVIDEVSVSAGAVWLKRELLGRLRQMRAFAVYLLDFYGELAQNLVDFDRLKEAASGIETVDIVDDVGLLERIYTRYIGLLESYGLADINHLKLQKKINIAFAGDVHIALSGLLTAFERYVLDEIARKSRLRVYLGGWCCPPISLLEWLDVDDRESFTSPQSDITITRTTTRYDTVRWVKSVVLQQLQKGIAPDDILVVLPDDSLIGLMRMLGGELFNFSAGFGLEESVYMRFLRAFLDAYREKPGDGLVLGVHFERLIAHPFVRVKNLKKYEPVYDRELSGAFQCLGKLMEKKRVTLQQAAARLKRCFKGVQYSSDDPDFIEARDTLFDELDRLSMLDSDIVRLESDPLDILEFIYDTLATVRFADVKGGPVTVVGMLESRLLSRKVMIVPLMNEEVFPKKLRKDMFLNSTLRKRCGLPTWREREELQRYHFSSLLANADKVFLGYVENDVESPSRFIVEMTSGNNPAIKVETTQFESVEGVSSFKGRSVELIKKPPDVARKSPEDDEKIKKMSFSAHSITDFKECPYRFYLRYLKGVSSGKDYTDESVFEMGRIVHEVMESLYKEHGEPITAREELEDRIRRHFSEIIENSAYCRTNPLERLKAEYICYRILHSGLIDEEVDRNSRIERIDVEVDFSIEIAGKRVTGRIDRVDRLKGGGFAIVDYKTGTVDEIKSYDKPYNVQLPLYAIAIETKRNDRCRGLYYLSFKEMKYRSMDGILERFDEFKQDIRMTVERMLATEEFKKEKRYCGRCPYRQICRT